MNATVSIMGALGKVRLELLGDVLLVQHRTSASSTSFYVPGEWIRLDFAERRDFFRFIRGLLGAAAALFLIFLALCGVMDLLDKPDGPIQRLFTHSDAALFGGAVVGFFAILTLSWWRYRKPRSYVHFTANNHPGQAETETEEVEEEQEEEDIELDFRFWYAEGVNAELDRLLTRLKALPEEIAATRAYPMKVGYMWEHIRPWRAALIIGLRGTIGLYVVSMLAEWILEYYYGDTLDLPAWLLGVFALPWIFGGGLLLIDAIRLRFEPLPFRQGMRHYYREEFSEARTAFLEAHRQHPDHEDTLVLLTQLFAHSFDFDRAFHFCGLLEHSDPEMADSLQESLWSLKRLSERMGNAQHA